MDGCFHGEQEMIRTIIIGASGQVARSLLERLHQLNDREILVTSSSQKGAVLDLSNPESIRSFLGSLPKTEAATEVFLVGAMTHVDRCETEKDRCQQINFEGPRLVAQLCAERGFQLVFFSSEYVFGESEYQGGAVGPFSEADSPAPTSFYGKSKLDAEEAIQSILPTSLILRTTMVFSWDPKGMNFFMQVWRYLRDLQSGGQPPMFRIPEDQISSPTYAPALAAAAIFLQRKGASGIVNIVGSDCLSRRDFVSRIIDAFAFSPEMKEEKFQYLKTKELGQVAKRPLTAGLKTDKARALGATIFSLEQAFADIKRQMASL